MPSVPKRPAMIPISRQDGKPFRLIDYFSGLRQQTHQIADWIGGMTFVPMSACPNLW